MCIKKNNKAHPEIALEAVMHNYDALTHLRKDFLEEHPEIIQAAEESKKKQKM